MKKTIKYLLSYLIVILLMAGIFNSCSKDEELGQVSGVVMSSGQLVLENAKVTINTSPSQEISTGANGAYQFIDLELSKYTIEVLIDGFEKETQEINIINDNPQKLDLLLIPIPVIENLGQVSGVIMTSDQLTLENAKVTINTSPSQEIITGEDGIYNFIDIQAAEYTIEVKLDGYEKKTHSLIVKNDSIHELDFVYPSLRDRVMKTWIFTEKPETLLHGSQGYTEDYTVYTGDEEFDFNESGTFLIDGIQKGEWTLIIDNWYLNSDKSILIDNSVTYEIMEITDSTMILNHPFYVFQSNRYKLRVK